MNLGDEEKGLIEKLVIALAKLRHPGKEIEPAGYTKSLENSITYDEMGDCNVVVFWYNIGKNTHGETLKLKPKKEGENGNPCY